MSQELFYDIFKTTGGWIGLVGSANGLVRLTLSRRSREGVFQQLGINAGQAVSQSNDFQGVKERLSAYFAGKKVDFPDRLDLSAATVFQREVWEATRHIPYGETRSYMWVAAQIGKPRAARAVGQDLGRNPLPIIIPCHRVLASNGGLGGFTGGLKMKRYLLGLEAAAG